MYLFISGMFDVLPKTMISNQMGVLRDVYHVEDHAARVLVLDTSTAVQQ